MLRYSLEAPRGGTSNEYQYDYVFAEIYEKCLSEHTKYLYM